MDFIFNKKLSVSEYRKCVVCGYGKLDPFFLSDLRGVPHGKPEHHVVYDYDEILGCDKCGCGQVERYSHDCWSNDDPWDMYWWYAFPKEGVDELKVLVKDCPSPANPKCECSLHVNMRKELEWKYSDIPHASAAEEVEKFCWLLLQVDEKEKKVTITLDKSKEFGEVA